MLMKKSKLPHEDEIRRILYQNADKSIQNTIDFIEKVELGIEILYDPRLASREGTISVLNEHLKHAQLTKSMRVVWYNQARDSNGYQKLYFEV